MTIQQLSLSYQIEWFNGVRLDRLKPLMRFTRCGQSEAYGFVATIIRLVILVVLVFLSAVFLRMLIELKIEQRRVGRLAATKSISSLTPAQFEAYVGLLFERAGYLVKRRGGRGDSGIDLVVNRRGRVSVVQCKRYEDNIGPSTVRELIGTMTNVGAEHGFLVTTSKFTAGAEREAQKAPFRIDLVDGGRLVRWAGRYGLPGDLTNAPGSDTMS